MADAIYLDLDEIETPKVTIKLNNVRHELKALTLSDWIANTREIERLKISGEIETESDVIMKMITRAFPTLSFEILAEIPLAKLNAILEFANGQNGGNVATKEAKAQAAANPPSAPVAEAPVAISPR